MQLSPLETLSTNIPLLKREAMLEYLRRSGVPLPTKYIPHTPEYPQALFLALTCLDAFYGGAAGGMKSDALLMAALQYVDVPGYGALLLRDSYTNLSGAEGLIERAREWLSGTDARPKDDGKTWLFPSGARLDFGYLDSPKDHFNYQSKAYQFVGIDEAVQIRQHQALYMFSRLRRLLKYADRVPLRFRCASNPPAREQLVRGKWVKERYVEPAKAVIRARLSLDPELSLNVADLPADVRPVVWDAQETDPDTQERRVVQRAFMPASMNDNPYLDVEEYKRSMSQLDYVTRRQLEKGDWEVKVAGRMVDRSWFEIVDAFPQDARRVRYWDMAATEPSAKNADPCWTVGVRMSRTDQGIVYIEHVEDFQEQSGQAERVIRQRADLDASEVGRHPIRMEEEPGASGKANTVNYRTKVLPMYDYKGERASGAKPVRFVPFANQAEAGNVYLVRGAWNSRYLDALEGLPDAGWDHADATSGAYNYLAGIDRAQGRIRVIEGGVGKRGDGAQPARKTDAAPEGTVPVYDRGRFIGYERELRDAAALAMLGLVPVYDGEKLVRYERSGRPAAAGRARRGVSG